MKEERMAILSMVEKGIITVDEAERLFAAIKGDSKRAKVEEIMSKAGDKLNILAKNVNKKTEKIMNDAKPALKTAGEKMEKVVEDVKPQVKKAAETFSEKAEEIKDKIKERRQKDDECVYDYDCCEDWDDEECERNMEAVKDSDFEKEVTIIPFEESTFQEKTEENTAEEDKKED